MNFDYLKKYSSMRSLESFNSVLNNDQYNEYCKILINDIERMLNEKPEWYSDMILYGKISEARFAWMSVLEKLHIESVMLGADPAKELTLNGVRLRNRHVDALLYEQRDLGNGYIANDMHYIELKTNVSFYFVNKNEILFDQVIDWSIDKIYKIETHTTEKLSRYVVFCSALTFFKMPEKKLSYLTSEWIKKYVSRIGMPNKTRNIVSDIFQVEIEDLFVYDRKLNEITYINYDSCLFNSISGYYEKKYIQDPMTISAAARDTYSPEVFKEEFLLHIEHKLKPHYNILNTELQKNLEDASKLKINIKDVNSKMKDIEGEMRVCI